MVIRRLGKNDVSIAGQVAERFLEQPAVSPAHLDRLLADDRNIVVVALEEETPVGFLIAHEFPSLSGQKLVYLYDIEVLQAHRRSGVGRGMVSQLKAICRDRAVESIWVGSSLSNTAACSLWKATGAERVSDQYAEFIYRFDTRPAEGSTRFDENPGLKPEKL